MLIRAAKMGYKISAIPVSHKKNYTNKKTNVNIRLATFAFLDLLKLRFLK